MKKADYYKSLAEIQLMESEDVFTPVNKIMIAKGVVIKMESDLLLWLKNNAPTPYSNEKGEQINLLYECIDHFQKISMVNMQYREVHKINNDWLEEMKQENSQLHQHIDKLNRILEASTEK